MMAKLPFLKFNKKILIVTTAIKVMAIFIPNNFMRDDYNKNVMT